MLYFGNTERGPLNNPLKSQFARPDPRKQAVRILDQVGPDGPPLDGLLQAGLALFHGRDRSLFHKITLGALRNRAMLDAVIERVIDLPDKRIPTFVRNTLRVGIYQILYLDRVPDHAAADTAVRMMRKGRYRGMAGWVNAVLRQVAGAGPAILESVLDSFIGPFSDRLGLETTHPEWLTSRWTHRYGAENAEKLCRFNNQDAPAYIRLNPLAGVALEDLLRSNPQSEASKANNGRSAGEANGASRRGEPVIKPVDWLEYACEATDAGFLAGHPLYKSGGFSMQGLMSQAVVRLLDAQPGDSVLDLCAAPGNKTCAIAERMRDSGRILAVDISARRLKNVESEAKRLRMKSIETLAADACVPMPELDLRFDRVLADAPCSGFGVLRQHPDIRFRRQKSDPERFAATQAEILAQASAYLKPGGRLVYSVCTFEPEETDAVIDSILQRRPSLRLTPIDEIDESFRRLMDSRGRLLSLPFKSGYDGFFAAVLS